MAQNYQIKIVSPRGIAVYPWLNRPDTKFSADGDFKVTLKLQLKMPPLSFKNWMKSSATIRSASKQG